MNRLLQLLPVTALIALTACNPAVKRTESGLEYIVYRGNGGGPAPVSGSTVKLHYQQLFHDTVTMSTYEKMPYYKALIPGTIFAYDPFEVLAHDIREGDSIVVMRRLDSLLSKGKLAKLPPNSKPTDKLLTCIKVLRIFPFDIMNTRASDSLLYVDKVAEKRKIDSIQTIMGPKRVQNYLAQKNINATATPTGAYLQVIEPGSGIQADSGRQVFVQYKVSTLQGKVIDTNMDSTFHHTDALIFEAGSQYMMKPVDQALRGLKKGGHAKIYIPTMLTNNHNGEGAAESGYDDIIFEILLLDVIAK